jgi:primosomal protein N'
VVRERRTVEVMTATRTALTAAADVDVDAARRWVSERGHQPVGPVANVLVDGSGRLGALSYLVPDTLSLTPGDAVEVPFGTRQAYGMVLGAGDPAQATRAVTTLFGKRADATEIACAQLIADRHFVELGQVAKRLSPTSGKGADPVTDWELALTEAAAATLVPDLSRRDDDVVDVVRRFAARPPAVDPGLFAAKVTAELAKHGQVLVLCPTVELVDDVLASFEGGARRIDAKADRGAWRGFAEGSVRVGVGTRTAALFSAANLAAIVVVEQERPGHVEARMPNTHARDVALLRSVLCKVPVVFTGAIPTPPALTAGVKLVETDGGWPEFSVVDRSELSAKQRMLPPAVLTEVRRAAKEGITPLVLVERAQAVHRCERCDNRRDHDGCETAFGCEHTFDACPTCGGGATRPVGWDAARIDRLFGGQVRPVTLKQLASQRDAGLVVIFDLDPAWRRADLSPDVQAAHVLMTAARAAGPVGHVMVCTSEPEQRTLQALAVHRSPRLFALHLWEQYRLHRLPPFGRLVTILLERKTRPSTSGWPGQVLGPRPAPGGWEILVRIRPDQLKRLEPHISRFQRGGRCRVTVS